MSGRWCAVISPGNSTSRTNINISKRTHRPPQMPSVSRCLRNRTTLERGARSGLQCDPSLFLSTAPEERRHAARETDRLAQIYIHTHSMPTLHMTYMKRTHCVSAPHKPQPSGPSVVTLILCSKATGSRVWWWPGAARRSERGWLLGLAFGTSGEARSFPVATKMGIEMRWHFSQRVSFGSPSWKSRGWTVLGVK